MGLPVISNFSLTSLSLHTSMLVSAVRNYIL